MALNTAAVDSAANTLKTTLAYASLHSATPNASGSNETTAARVAVSWSGPSTGAISASNLAFTGVAASGAVGFVGFWSASSSGTFYGYLPLTGDSAANAAGAYTVSSVTVTVSAS